MLNKVIDNKKWYVITTRPRAEKQVSKRLTETGIENFLPVQSQLRRWHDRKKRVDVPLFPSYIFVKIHDRWRSKVFNIAGIIRYLSLEGRACVLSEDEIERVRCLCSYSETVTIEEGPPRSGDPVEIVGGHLAGLCGRLLESGGRHRVKISIDGLGCSAVAYIDESIVRKIV